VSENEASPGPGLSLALRATRVVAALFSLVSLVLVLWVVIGRFIQPAQAEWMTGAVRDGVERVRNGQQLYAEPSAGFVAYIYPPLYFWIAGTLAKGMSLVAAGRLVSIAASIVTGASIWKIARSLGATRMWAAFGLALHLGAYSYTLWFYDLERVDPLEAAISSAAIAVLLHPAEGRRDLVQSAIGGALLGLSYFAKQPGLFVFVAAIGGIAAAREWKRAMIVTASGVVVAAGLGAYAQSASGGWFSYYVMKLPSAHGIKPSLITLFWLTDVPKGFVLSLASIGIVAAISFKLIRGERPPWREVLFASVVGGSMMGAFLLRAHVGGFINVMLCWTPFGCAAAAVASSRILGSFEEPRARATIEIGLLAAVSLQLAGWLFDPNEVTPGPFDLKEDNELARVVHLLEKEGEVIVTTNGNVTTPRHFHAAALYDVIRAGNPLPADYMAGLQSRKYAALLVGAPNETECELQTCKDAAIAVMSNYFVASRQPTPRRPSLVGFDARAGWLMRPRKHPLTGMSLDALNERVRIEQGLAEARAAIGGKDADPAQWHDDIEDLAAQQQAAMSSKR
jgi:hypothetical protein